MMAAARKSSNALQSESEQGRAGKPSPDARWLKTRQRLLDGGRKAFAKHGVEATSVLEIIRAAGVSQPSFYNHFASKDELAREIAAEFFHKDKQAKQAVFEQTDDPAEAIAINVFHTLSIATEDPVIAWTLVKSEGLRDLVISSKKDPLAEMITTGIAKGRFVASDAHTIALVIRGGAFAVIQDMLNGTAADDVCACYQEMVLRMLGLSPQESTATVKRAQAKIRLNEVI
jgi:AcrR family transcriptional regulator